MASQQQTQAADTSKTSWFDNNAPTMAEPWRQFHDSVYETGELPLITKELIAVAIAGMDRCEHCTRGHIRAALTAGATKEQVSEALMIAALIASGAELHWLADDFAASLGDEGEKQPWFVQRTNGMGDAWVKFHDAVYQDSALDRKTKELVATAAACTARCPHCTRAHIKQAIEHGASRQEVSEALMVTALLASGTELNWAKDSFSELLG